MRKEEVGMRNFKFDLQRFGKDSGSTTVTTEHEQTEDELKIIAQQAKIAEAYAPNAMKLNDIAWNLLNNSVGAVQQDFNALKDQALGQIDFSVKGLYDIINNNTQSATDTSQQLKNIYDTLTMNTNAIHDDLNSYSNALINGIFGDEGSLATNKDDLKTTQKDNYDSYRTLYKMLTGTLNYINPEMDGFNYDDVVDENSILGQYATALKQDNTFDVTNGMDNTILIEHGKGVNNYLEKYQTEDLNNLANDTLPTNFTQNMTDAIKKSMTNTIGATMNDLANRGVLNSSVTNKALDDIENNVADSLANHYLQNIGTVQNLVGNQAELAQQQYQNTIDNLNSQQSNLNNLNDLYKNYSDTRLNYDQQRFDNQMNAYNNIYNSLLNGKGQTYNMINQTLNNQADWTQQGFNNTLNANNSNAGLYQNVGINMANAPITSAAAAQEAAQNPAINLWNASIGLTGSNNGTLAALAGSNQNSTTTTSGGGGLLSGLFGGLF